MERRVTEISIDGRRLLLAERLTADVHLLAKTAGVFLKNDGNGAKRLVIQANIVHDALKINLSRLKKYQILRRWKVKRLISTNNLIKNPKLLGRLYEKLIEEVEAVEISSKEKPIEISETFQYVLVANISGISISKVSRLPITVFREILELAINWGNFLRGGNFELLSSIDRRLKLIKEHKELFPEMWN